MQKLNLACRSAVALVVLVPAAVGVFVQSSSAATSWRPARADLWAVQRGKVTVRLPAHADAPASVTDEGSGVSALFALHGARPSPLAEEDSDATYAGVFPGVDLRYRRRADGAEDDVVFARAPDVEQVTYGLSLSRVAGLRLVSGTLELLDARGVPRLRVEPPFVQDARGERIPAALSVEGCAFDANPAAPWRRPVTPPGSAHCTLRVAWHGASYPATLDPAWTSTGSMATGRYWHTATLLASGDVLVAGGYNGGSKLATAELYDPTSGTFAATGSMSAGRMQQTATLLPSGKVLVAGGAGAGGVSAMASAELYDPVAGTFSSTGSLNSARATASATLLGSGLVLIAGGSVTKSLTSAELFDPSAGTFTLTGSLKYARSLHVAVLLATGKVLVAGGSDAMGDATSTAEIYDPTSGTFALTGSMTEDRQAAAGALLKSGHVLIAGGNAFSKLSSTAELYDPVAGTFTATGSMAATRDAFTATALSSGDVLVVGGESSFVAANASAELYDPGAGAFVSAGSMATARFGHTATLLSAGDVLVTGGDSEKAWLSTAELYRQPLDAGTEAGGGGSDAAGDARDEGSNARDAAAEPPPSEGGAGVDATTDAPSNLDSGSESPPGTGGGGCSCRLTAVPECPRSGAAWMGLVVVALLLRSRMRS